MADYIEICSVIKIDINHEKLIQFTKKLIQLIKKKIDTIHKKLIQFIKK